MSRDYTREAPVEETLQDALNLALGADRVGPGETLVARSVEQVGALLSACNRFGGHVTTGEPTLDEIGLDLSQLTEVRELDVTSGLITVEAGCTARQLDVLAAEAGLAIEFGHFSTPDRPIGEALMAGEGYPLVVSVGAVLPDGTIFHTPVAPRRASGPNPDALLVGTEGRFGLVVWVTLRATPRPARVHRTARRGPRAEMIEALRTLYRKGYRPTAAWLVVDDSDTATVTVVSADAPIEPLAAALVIPGSHVVETDADTQPPADRPRRLGWRAIAAALDQPGAWLGPTDLHGGYVRLPGDEPGTDASLDALRGLLDPQDTLRVR